MAFDSEEFNAALQKIWPKQIEWQPLKYEEFANLLEHREPEKPLVFDIEVETSRQLGLAMENYLANTMEDTLMATKPLQPKQFTRAGLTRLTTRDKEAFWGIAEGFGIKRARGLQFGRVIEHILAAQESKTETKAMSGSLIGVKALDVGVSWSIDGGHSRPQCPHVARRS